MGTETCKQIKIKIDSGPRITKALLIALWSPKKRHSNDDNALACNKTRMMALHEEERREDMLETRATDWAPEAAIGAGTRHQHFRSTDLTLDP